ncbi:electron transfer flavoprotein alpha subunit apoprotein [Paraburkholderia sp. BL23I1N1]|uniref:electron transfer flavoprotein subunit alpha/FixB family protein n=1 Tax=Paraburkholderia sp. BL23I1N1 TaxID=1938802 RepID=UPI000E715A19|nr:electron transfer flavoprotein subunit alpha/FixB family protein [Paraburkholderia sp. BL23I1N1]RKE26079.1 electron transfer flavoprotein alpha subunit apoprotein [Paraburkholderia sp. BL23I1N1]
MRSLVVAESENGRVADATLRVITAVVQRGLPVDVFLPDAALASSVEKIAGVERVLVMASAASECFVPEILAAQLHAVHATHGPYSLIAASHRTLGRSALPRAAALAGGAFIPDVIAVEGDSSYMRSLYAGSVVANVASASAVTFSTIRPSSFAPATDSGGNGHRVTLEPITGFSRTRLVERQASAQAGRELADARIVVAGGRGLASKDNMDRLGKLAESLGAALGASRAAVDAGYAPNTAQVGQTGKMVAPDVYLAFGISGAIQHLAGMKDSKTIVAINKDPDAPIFSVADIGFVGDLFEVVDALETQVSAGSASQ